MGRKIKNIIIALLALRASSAFGLMAPPPPPGQRPTSELAEENRRLRRRVGQLERQLRELGAEAERERLEEERIQKGLRRQREEAVRAQREAGMGAMMAEMRGRLLKRKLQGIERAIRQRRGIDESLLEDLRETVSALKEINPDFEVNPFLRRYLMPPPRPAQRHPRRIPRKRRVPKETMPRHGHVREMSELFERKAAENHR